MLGYVLFMEESLDGMVHHRMCYALIPRKDKEGSSEIPLEV